MVFFVGQWVTTGWTALCIGSVYSKTYIFNMLMNLRWRDICHVDWTVYSAWGGGGFSPIWHDNTPPPHTHTLFQHGPTCDLIQFNLVRQITPTLSIYGVYLYMHVSLAPDSCRMQPYIFGPYKWYIKCEPLYILVCIMWTPIFSLWTPILYMPLWASPITPWVHSIYKLQHFDILDICKISMKKKPASLIFGLQNACSLTYVLTWSAHTKFFNLCFYFVANRNIWPSFIGDPDQPQRIPLFRLDYQPGNLWWGASLNNCRRSLFGSDLQ